MLRLARTPALTRPRTAAATPALATPAAPCRPRAAGARPVPRVTIRSRGAAARLAQSDDSSDKGEKKALLHAAALFGHPSVCK